MWCCKQHPHASAAGDNCEAPVVSTLVHLNGSGLPPCPVRCSKPSLCSFLHKMQKFMVADDCVSILPANSTHKYGGPYVYSANSTCLVQSCSRTEPVQTSLTSALMPFADAYARKHKLCKEARKLKL